MNELINCSDCPFGNNECGWAHCPTKDEWRIIKDHFKDKVIKSLENFKLPSVIEAIKKIFE